MQLEHSFTVPVGIEDAWKVLLDIEQVAPCMPGAALETVTGDAFTGSVKVKLGPISMTYKGKASFVEKDAAAHRATIDAQGQDSRGAGTAAAKVTATLAAEGDSTTRVDVITDLNITGKPAQFGRGVMVDVGNKLIGQFADCLAGKLAGGDSSAPPASPTKTVAAAKAPAKAAAKKVPAKKAPAKAPTKAAAKVEPKPAEPKPAEKAPAPTVPPVVTRIAAREDVEPIDLMAHAGPAVAKRVIPLAAVLAALVAVFVVRRRRR